MNKSTNIQNKLILFGIPFFLIGMSVFISKTQSFQQNSEKFAIGITFELLLTIPFIYYLLIRKTNISKTTVVLFLILGVIICTLILPSENQYYLSLFKTWILPIIELFVITYVIYTIRKVIKVNKLKKSQNIDFFTALKNTCFQIFPKSVVIHIVTEIAVFYYGFIYWKKRHIKENEFSYHKKSGTITLLIAIIIIVAIETYVFHVLLLKWNKTAAWFLTFLSVYSAIQLFGFLKSMLKRPILIDDNQLLIRYGIMTETTIDISDIESIEISSKDLDKNSATRKLSFLGNLESHNTIIYLKKDYYLIGLYGIKRKYRNLAIYVDDKIEFKNRIFKNHD